MPTAPKLATALATFAASECRRAIRSLGDSKQPHKGIHEARKALRRLKSLLRLGATVFDDALPPLEIAIDRLAVSLSSVRDAHVAVLTARLLAGADPSDGWKHAIDALELRSEGRLTAALIKDPRFLERRKRIRELAHAIAALPWRKLSRHAIEHALANSEKRVAKARKRMRTSATTANLHRWRRRARRLRMQLELIRKARKAAGMPASHHAERDKALARTMSALSDTIGSKQDLRALRKTLRTIVDPDTMPALIVAITHELKKHRTPTIESLPQHQGE
ncbi:CHAD domain-containing protein [Luteibacter sp. 9133]|uniref:CHAD domain-containing protein n=1 Tax=Luteibacter sp. 9133 TaxID=1500891 RepID=UPI0005B902DD|nr:CHAD domain-containing protein [Luteibacter sp. 9133]